MTTFSSIAAVALAFSSVCAAGTITEVPDSQSFVGNDFIDWAQLPTTGTNITGSLYLVAAPLTVQSQNGLDVSVNSPAAQVYRDQQGNPWLGNFAPNDYLLGSGQYFESAPITLTFGSPIYGFSTQFGYDIITDTPVLFLYSIDVFDTDQHLLQSFSGTGYMDNHADSSSPFFGAVDTLAEIGSVQVFAKPADISSNIGFAINRVNLITTDPPAVPEPGALSLVSLALGWVVLWKGRHVSWLSRTLHPSRKADGNRAPVRLRP